MWQKASLTASRSFGPFFFSLIVAFFYLFQFGVDVERRRVDVRGLGNNKKHRWQVMLASCALRQSQQRPAKFPVSPVKQEQRLAHVGDDHVP